MAVNRVLERLQQANCKMTPQRMAVLQVLEENQGRHLTAEQIFLMVKHRMPLIGMATVYRTLELFAGLGVLNKASFDEARFRYEFGEEDRHRHHHLMCVECGEIAELEEDLLHSLERQVEESGFQVLDHALVIYGRCARCRGLA
ncbi:MAG: Fur family transcriptional regulator [Syntrophomonadaceae bacterium]|jgi:Fur family ferric uptake transcriptional regulator|nr:transcriptional repressor [Syntrophomonadaceae bacterium]MDH7498622.1 Fur family transcriptional regulator [Syntrophomonadaceae bacterium]